MTIIEDELGQSIEDLADLMRVATAKQAYEMLEGIVRVVYSAGVLDGTKGLGEKIIEDLTAKAK